MAPGHMYLAAWLLCFAFTAHHLASLLHLSSILLKRDLVALHIIIQMKKRSEDTQTLRAGCSKAEPKNFRPAADLFPGGEGRPKFNKLEMVTTFTYRPSVVKIDACNFELSW